MSTILLLTSALQPSAEVLPGLALLGHQVRVLPPEGSALLEQATATGEGVVSTAQLCAACRRAAAWEQHQRDAPPDGAAQGPSKSPRPAPTVVVRKRGPLAPLRKLIDLLLLGPLRRRLFGGGR